MQIQCFIAIVLLGAGFVSMAWVIGHDLPDGRYHITLPKGNVTTSKPIVKRFPHDMASGRERRSKENPGLFKRLVDFNKHNSVYPKKFVDHIWVADKETGKVPMPISAKGCEPARYPKPLDPDDYYASKQSFNHWCTLYHSYGDHIELSLKGTVAVFACTNGPQMSCSGLEYEYAEGIFNITCGDDRPAWVFMKKWAKGYGRAARGMDVCGQWGMQHVSD